MPDIVITPASANIVFSSTANAATIRLDTSTNTLIIEANGGVQLGNTASDVYIGDGVNSIDIVYEQDGDIRALGGKTLTIGQANSNIILAGQTSMSASFTGAIKSNVATGSAILELDGAVIIRKTTSQGALMIGKDDAVHIAAGESQGPVHSLFANSSEQIVLGAEFGVFALAASNNWNGESAATNHVMSWTGRGVAVGGGLGLGTLAATATLDVRGNANVSSTLAVGNTTITGFVNATVSVNSALITVGTSLIGNTTGIYHTGTMNAASHTTSGMVANATGVYPTSNTVGTALGSATQRWVLIANTGAFSGAITSSGGVNPASNTVGTALGTTTARWILTANTGTFAGAVSGITTLAAGNTTITGFANVTTTLQVGTNTATFGTAAYIVANGNVGIGMPSPIFPLQIKTNTGATSQALQLNTTEWTTSVGSAFQVGFGASSGNTYSEIRALSEGYNVWNNLVLQSGGGNVGIGTTAPYSQLHLTGTTTIGSGTSARPAFKPTNWGYSSSYRALLIGSASTDYTATNTGAVTVAFNYDPSSNPSGSFGGNGSEILFRRGTSFLTPNAADNAFNINITLLDSSVGIGNTTPASGDRLSVNGNVYVSGTLTEASSLALKENIDPITGALSVILGINGYTYDRKDGSRKHEPGLIAEEVAAVLPNVVQYNDEGNPQGIQYTKIIAYLIESIKELKAEIDILKDK